MRRIYHRVTLFHFALRLDEMCGIHMNRTTQFRIQDVQNALYRGWVCLDGWDASRIARYAHKAPHVPQGDTSKEVFPDRRRWRWTGVDLAWSPWSTWSSRMALTSKSLPKTIDYCIFDVFNVNLRGMFAEHVGRILQNFRQISAKVNKLSQLEWFWRFGRAGGE